MKDHYKKIFLYEKWANLQVADALLSIPDIPEKPLSLLSHIINAQKIWLGRIKNENPNTQVWQIYDRTEIKDKINHSSSGLLEFIESISGNDIKKMISYKNTRGDKFTTAIEDMLIHLTHHSAYHRGQIVLLIKDMIPVLPGTDYIIFERTNGLK